MAAFVGSTVCVQVRFVRARDALNQASWCSPTSMLYPTLSRPMFFSCMDLLQSARAKRAARVA
jgi:hypothetical protein